MAFQAIGSAPQYMCLSADVKPVTAAAIRALGIEAGAIAVETDTGNRFIFDGTAWQPVSGSTAVVAHTAVTVGAASVQVVAANAARKYLLIINDSDAVIYLNFGAAAVANTGIRLNAEGGNLELASVAGNLYTGVINAISSAANKNLLVTQV